MHISRLPGQAFESRLDETLRGRTDRTRTTYICKTSLRAGEISPLIRQLLNKQIGKVNGKRSSKNVNGDVDKFVFHGGILY